MHGEWGWFSRRGTPGGRDRDEPDTEVEAARHPRGCGSGGRAVSCDPALLTTAQSSCLGATEALAFRTDQPGGLRGHSAGCELAQVPSLKDARCGQQVAHFQRKERARTGKRGAGTPRRLCTWDQVGQVAGTCPAVSCLFSRGLRTGRNWAVGVSVWLHGYLGVGLSLLRDGTGHHAELPHGDTKLLYAQVPLLMAKGPLLLLSIPIGTVRLQGQPAGGGH